MGLECIFNIYLYLDVRNACQLECSLAQNWLLHRPIAIIGIDFSIALSCVSTNVQSIGPMGGSHTV
jgi:hypothetical protein